MEFKMAENYLVHYGILGMKWGQRRYQNPDGSLTTAGKDRYSDKSITRSVKRKEIADFNKEYYKEVKLDKLNRSAKLKRSSAKQEQAIVKYKKKESDRDLTPKERKSLYKVERKKSRIEKKYAKTLKQLTTAEKKEAVYDKIIAEEMNYLDEAKTARGKEIVDKIIKDYHESFVDWVI